MPTTLRQLKSYRSLPQQEKVKFIQAWMNELTSRLDAVKAKAQHTVNLLKFHKQIAETKLKIDAIARQNSKEGRALVDRERRLIDLYGTLKSYEATVFDFERDVLRPDSDGAKKQKLIANIQKELSKVTSKLDKLRVVYNDAILLHDQYGSDKGVMESVNTGRTLLDRMSKFEIQFTAYLGKLKDLNAKFVSVREWNASLKLLLDTNAPLLERVDKLISFEAGVAKRLRGVTRKVAKQVGAIKKSYMPDVSRKFSATKSRSKLAIKLEETFLSGSEALPDPATVFVEKLRSSRVSPEVKELGYACVELSVGTVSNNLTPAVQLISDVQENKEHSQTLTSDTSVLQSALLKTLASKQILQAKTYSNFSMNELKKFVVGSKELVHNTYVEDVLNFFQHHFV